VEENKKYFVPVCLIFEVKEMKAVMVKDPVCGMEVNEKTAKYEMGYEGKKYYFCSVMCKEEFEKVPRKYVKME